MDIVHGFSLKTSAQDAARELSDQFADFDGRMVLYFASSCFDQQELAHAMASEFQSATVVGCSTAGEIVSGQMLKNSVVAMALNDAIVESVQVAVVTNLAEGPDISEAFESLEAKVGARMEDLDHEKYVGIILVDGLRGAEEALMDQIGDHTNVTFIGGSAGDDLQFQQTHVYAGGKAHTNAAVLALLKVRKGFEIIKSQSFCELDQKLTVTKAVEAQREVLEFNGQPAVQAYAEAVGTQVASIDDHFMNHPVGLMIDGEPYVRSPQQTKGDSMVFYCNVLEGMDLSLLESTDIVTDTTKAVAAKLKELGKISGLINFHCILRTLELEAKKQTAAYGKVFADIPTIGFSTYGEEYLGHINQTSTMLVFK